VTLPDRVLILAETTATRDPRVRRQIEALRSTYDVVVAGKAADLSALGVSAIKLPAAQPSPPLRKTLRAAQFAMRRYERFYWHPSKVEALSRLRGIASGCALVLTNELPMLPLGIRLGETGPAVMLDAHEFYPGEWQDSWSSIWRRPYVDWLCRTGLPRVRCVTTVSRGVAHAYLRQYGTKCELVTNASPYHRLRPSPVGDKIRLVHHGAAIRGRRIERMIDAVKRLGDNYELHLVLVASAATEAYAEKLRRLAGRDPRIHFHAPVATTDVCNEIHKYDLGIYLLPPEGLNNYHALPNKVFEFVQARLGMVVSPNPDMADFVRENQLGRVAADFTPRALAEAIRRISPQEIRDFKENAHDAASKFTAEHEGAKLRALVAGMIG
jgi:hypothetical protein